MEQLGTLLFVLGALIALALAAPRWGQDSTDRPYSAEWELRRLWRGYGG